MVSPLWEFCRCSGTAPGSNSTSLWYISVVVVPLRRRLLRHGGLAAWRDGDLNFFKPKVWPVYHFRPSPLCSIGRQEERKTDSKDDNDGPGSDGASLAAMQELLSGLPRLAQGGASSNPAVVDPEAYREWFPISPNP
ncbi:hypothetical protein HAX54_036598 [Datura stramonium]|uniref:Uncharacterized protein n=1 Tax=Datura stramonium TaxID=4076 RepID=A0ABS8VKW2_DATST|nr:hypothetical protein [Datura stramonium]